jgi:hypothetical protein
MRAGLFGSPWGRHIDRHHRPRNQLPSRLFVGCCAISALLGLLHIVGSVWAIGWDATWRLYGHSWIENAKLVVRVIGVLAIAAASLGLAGSTLTYFALIDRQRNALVQASDTAAALVKAMTDAESELRRSKEQMLGTLETIHHQRELFDPTSRDAADLKDRQAILESQLAKIQEGFSGARPISVDDLNSSNHWSLLHGFIIGVASTKAAEVLSVKRWRALWAACRKSLRGEQSSWRSLRSAPTWTQGKTRRRRVARVHLRQRLSSVPAASGVVSKRHLQHKVLCV